MTIQTINTTKANAPVLDVFSTLKKMFLIPLIIALLVSMVFGLRDGFSSFLLMFLIIFSLLFIIVGTFTKFIMAVTSHNGPYKKVHKYYRDFAIENGFNVSYEAVGVLVDETSRTIAFTIDPNRKQQLTICGFEDVREWYSEENRVTQKDNYRLHDSGVITGGQERTAIKTNFINVIINNPSKPLYSFKVRNSGDAQMWIGRLTSLING